MAVNDKETRSNSILLKCTQHPYTDTQEGRSHGAAAGLHEQASAARWNVCKRTRTRARDMYVWTELYADTDIYAE